MVSRHSLAGLMKVRIPSTRKSKSSMMIKIDLELHIRLSPQEQKKLILMIDLLLMRKVLTFKKLMN